MKKALKRQITYRAAQAILFSMVMGLLSGYTCGGPILDDAGFDLWCEDKLCKWTVQKGSILRVPTWHRTDWGVSLVGDEVVLHQDSGITSSRVQCIKFKMQANRDDSVSLFLKLDFLKNGKIDYSHPLISNDWKAVEYKLKTPSWYDGVRFLIVKKGRGRAVLTQFSVTEAKDCKGDPIPLDERFNGVACENDGQCLSRHCGEAALFYGSKWNKGSKSVPICGECKTDGDCPEDKICGLGTTKSRWHQACVKPNSSSLGARCLKDKECATGICCSGVCSTCCNDKGCSDQDKCERYEANGEIDFIPVPWQCSPMKKKGLKGDTCLRNGDCANNYCVGKGDRKICLNGSPCKTDSDCESLGSFLGSCESWGKNHGKCQ